MILEETDPDGGSSGENNQNENNDAGSTEETEDNSAVIQVLEEALAEYDDYQSKIYLIETGTGVNDAKAAYDAAADEAENLSLLLDTLLTTGSAEGAV